MENLWPLESIEIDKNLTNRMNNLYDMSTNIIKTIGQTLIQNLIKNNNYNHNENNNNHINNLNKNILSHGEEISLMRIFHYFSLYNLTTSTLNAT